MTEMDVHFIINKIKLEQNIYSDFQLAELFGVSASAVSNWKQRKKMPLSVLQKYCNNNNKVIDGYLNNVQFLKTTSIDKENKNKNYNKYKDSKMDMEYVVELQREKIKRLENDLARHKDSPFQSSQWDDLHYHIYSEVEINFSGLRVTGRKMTALKGKKMIETYMGYNSKEIDDLWQIGKNYEHWSKHPIDTILSKKSADDLKVKRTSLPHIFESLKHMMGNHYIPMPIGFICKDKSILHTICYNKVDWRSKKVYSKSEFLINE